MDNVRNTRTRSQFAAASANDGAPTGSFDASPDPVIAPPGPTSQEAGTEAAISPAITGAIEGAIQRSQQAMMEQFRALFPSAVPLQEAHRDQSPGLSSSSGSSSLSLSHPDRAANVTDWGDQPLPNLKLEGPPKLKRSNDYRIRDQWLKAVERVFEAAPAKYCTSLAKTYYALDRLEPDLAQDFSEYAEALPEQDGEIPFRSWKVFRNWFENVGSNKVQIRVSANAHHSASYQTPDQSPRDFAGQLAAYEHKMSALPDDYRADFFRNHLVPWLRSELLRVADIDTMSRDAVVTKAQSIWESRDELGAPKRKASPAQDATQSAKRSKISDREAPGPSKPKYFRRQRPGSTRPSSRAPVPAQRPPRCYHCNQDVMNVICLVHFTTSLDCSFARNL
ncbi:MAG: hypothetical protein SEPTF4163_006657 [Sporothrix epigloea]